MFVNGEPNDEFDQYAFHDEDVIVIRFEAIPPPAPTSVDLPATFDSGISNSDNVTNQSAVQFQVSGVVSGATVELLRGTTIIATGIASGTTITLGVANLGELGDGTYSLRARQTIDGATSELSGPLAVTLDTTPPGAFTSTPPTAASAGVPLVYDANVPGEGSNIVFSLAAAPSGATIDGISGELSWTPPAGQSGSREFRIAASDPAGNTVLQSFSIAIDLGFQAVADTFSTGEDSQSVVLEPLANDTIEPGSGNVLTITAVGPASQGGSVQITSGGTQLKYTPAENFFGTESFTYTVSNQLGETASATVTVQVQAQNDAPTAAADALSVPRDSQAFLLDVLANDTSAPDAQETLVIDSVSQAGHGTLAIVSDGTRLAYTPATGYTGPDSFTYTIRDPGGFISPPVTVSLSVEADSTGSIGGVVFFDVDNDGVKDSTESPLAGVTITLAGTAGGASVNQSARTQADGSYRFEDLPAGTYTITQSQPAFTLDGKDTPSLAGSALGGNDTFIVQLAANAHSTGNHFGERGRVASMISLRDFFASGSRDHIVAAVDADGAPLWHSTKGPAWEGYTGSTVALQNNASQVKLDGLDSSNRRVTATLPTSDRRVRTLGSPGASRLLKLSGGPGNGLSLSLAPAAALSAEDGEGEAPTTTTAAAVHDQALIALFSIDDQQEQERSRRLPSDLVAEAGVTDEELADFFAKA
jgi:hypothetical protein